MFFLFVEKINEVWEKKIQNDVSLLNGHKFYKVGQATWTIMLNES